MPLGQEDSQVNAIERPLRLDNQAPMRLEAVAPLTIHRFLYKVSNANAGLMQC
jgi:hypothetical protein